MNESTAYQSGIAYEYDQIIANLCGGDLTVYQKIIQNLLQLAPFHEKDKVIELACGTGIASELILEQPCQQLYCLDNSWAMLEMAEFRLSKRNPRWKFMEARWNKDHESEDEKLRLQGIYEPLTEIPRIKLIYQNISQFDSPQIRYLNEQTVDKIIMTNSLLSITFSYDTLFQAVHKRLNANGTFLFNIKLQHENNYLLLRNIVNRILSNITMQKIGVGYEDNTDLPTYNTKEDMIQIITRNGFEITDYLEEAIYIPLDKTLNYLNTAINRCQNTNQELNNFEFNTTVKSIFLQNSEHNSSNQFLLRNEGYFAIKKK